MVSMMAEESLNKNSSQEHSSDESLSESLSHPVGLEFLNNKIPLVPEEDSFVPSHAEGDVDMEEGEECVKDSYKHIMVGKDGIVIIGLCNFCQGPIFRTCKTGIDDTKFCSVRCLSGYSKMKMHLQQRDSTGREQEDGRDFQLPAEFSFDEFRDIIELRGAQPTCFKRITKEVKGLKPGMKLEVLDKNNPCNYCVATVIDVVGHRVQICYDGFGDDEGQDFWCNFQSEELFPIGWCAGNGYPLQPPCGISSSLEDWKTFLTKTLTGALAAPQELFRPGEERMQLHVHSFQAGTHVECINPKKPDVVCPATVTKSLGPYHYQVSTEPHQSCPSSQFFGHSETLGLFQVGWARKHGIALWFPSALYLQDGPDGRPCIQLKKFPAGGAHFSKRPRCNRFKVGQKLEAVDTLDHSVIRIATILWITGRLLLLYFDGTQRCQFVDCESEELYPCGWSKSTGHPLHTCYGVDSGCLSTHEPWSGDRISRGAWTSYSSDKRVSPDENGRVTQQCSTAADSELLYARKRPRFSTPRPVDVFWTLSGIDRQLFHSSERAFRSPGTHRHRFPRDDSPNVLSTGRSRSLSRREEAGFAELVQHLQETMEEGFARMARHLKILSSRLCILEERTELSLMDSPRMERTLLATHEPSLPCSRQLVHSSMQTEPDPLDLHATSSVSASSDASPSLQLIPRVTIRPGSVTSIPRLDISKVNHDPYQRHQFSEDVDQQQIDYAASNDSMERVSQAWTSSSASTMCVNNSVFTDGFVCASAVNAEPELTGPPLVPGSVKEDSDRVANPTKGVLKLSKSALLSKTLYSTEGEDVLSGLTAEQINAVAVVVRQQPKRHEFALKALDIMFTEEEQASMKAPGGGCLRNLDLKRLQKIKALCFHHYPVKDQETEESSWRYIVQKINSKCRCRRFSYKQKMQASS